MQKHPRLRFMPDWLGSILAALIWGGIILSLLKWLYSLVAG